jgi:putative peptide zinc metalloprotease protein
MATLAPSPQMLPPLRQELQIRPGQPQVNGAPSWTLFDPLRHLFYQVGRTEFRIFSLWSQGHPGNIQAELAADGLSDADAEDAIRKVLEFSLANSLTVQPAGGAVAAFTAQYAATRRAWWRWLVDHYLFIRIPMVRPAKFLERTLPLVAPLWSPTSLLLFALMGLTGLFLVARQWDNFVAPFAYLFSGEGLLAYAIALGLVKVAHELGHAYAATRFGCRVPAMGVSFLVMMPVLYTDTSAAWQLTSRRQRLIIDCAGVTVELMIASAATLLWALLPDGPARSAVHVVATTSWVTSLAINLSPFMRFDGYYMLSDALGMPNLQPRGFALGRWRLRELLFCLGEPPPEQLPTQLRRTVILYAWATWIYRFVLFLGIALLVYHLFFKALGIILFAVEMVVFIGRPVFSEIRQWHRLRDRIAASGRGRIWAWLLGGLVLIVVLPIDRHVSAPAVLTPIGDTPLVISSPARIDRILVRNDQLVERGAPLFILSDPAIERDITANEARIARLETQLARAGADILDLANITVLQRELMSERNGRAGLERRREQLMLRAQTAGRVIDIPTDLHVGRWLPGGAMLGRIVTPGRYDILAYVAENDIGRVQNGATARFVPDDAALFSWRARVAELGGGTLEFLNSPMLASTNGGPIAVSEDESHRLKPQKTIYSLRLVAERDRAVEGNAVVQQIPGRVVVRATGESYLARMVRGIGRLVARESALTG